MFFYIFGSVNKSAASAASPETSQIPEIKNCGFLYFFDLFYIFAFMGPSEVLISSLNSTLCLELLSNMVSSASAPEPVPVAFWNPYNMKSNKKAKINRFLKFFRGSGTRRPRAVWAHGKVNWIISGFRSEKCTRFFLGPRTSDFRP